MLQRMAGASNQFRTRRKISRRILCLVLIPLILLLAGLGLFVFSSEPKGPDFGDPGLVQTARTDFSKLSPNSDSRWQRVKFWIFALALRAFSPGPEAVTISPMPAGDPEVKAMLGMAHEFTGVRYHIEREIAEGTVMFGTTNSLNGREWVDCLEEALMSGKSRWHKDSVYRTNVVLLEFDHPNRLVLSEEKAEEYEKRFPRLKRLSMKSAVESSESAEEN